MRSKKSVQSRARSAEPVKPERWEGHKDFTAVRVRVLLNGLLALVGSLVYLNSLGKPFMFDDISAVVNNERIRDLSDLPKVLAPERERPVAGRPLANLSLAINYAIGKLDVVGYHVWNVAIHVLCGMLLFAVVRNALLLPGLPETLGDSATALAFIAALLWMLHPLNSEVVTYVTQRTESMMAFFYLLTLYASIRAR
jgi:hypothetical protein